MIGERYVGRPLTHSVWHEIIVQKEIKFFIFICICTVLFLAGYFFQFLDFFTLHTGIFKIRDDIKNILNSKTHGIELLLLFVVLIGVRCFYINAKKSMHIDEALSIGISNRNEYGFWGKLAELDGDKEYSGKELKDLSLWNDPSVKDSLDDVWNLYIDNKDSPHTNLYYSIYRLWFTGVKTNDLNYIFWRGCSLNILIFAVSFFFMIFLIRIFTKNSFLVFTCLIIAFINPASLSLTIFMRPYELQQLFVIIITYYVTCCLQAVYNNQKVESKKNFIIGIFVLALTMLSAYFNMIIIGFYGLILVIICLRKKDYNLLKFFIYMLFCSLIVAKLLYLSFGDGISGYRGQEAFSNFGLANLSANFFSVINGFYGMILSKNIFFALYFILIVLFLVLFLLSSKRNVKNFLLSIILSVAFVSLFLILWCAPGKTLRYIAPIFPIFSLAFVGFFKREFLNYTFSVLASFFLCVSLINLNGKPSVVEHIDDAGFDRIKKVVNTELPIFIEGKARWKYGEIIPYLNDDNRIFLISDISEIQEKHSDEIPCIFISERELHTNGDLNFDDFYIQEKGLFSYYDFCVLNSK
ncbi:MAG: hypothetical protein ACI4LX_05450 [Treponema sp.]